MPTLVNFVQQKLEKSRSANQLRTLKTSARHDGIYITHGNKKFISFSCNDYLGLSQNPAVKKAACDATEKYGTGGGASRLVTGNNPLYEELETLLASIKKTEAALVLGSGYLTNTGVIPALAGKGDLIIADRLVHASIIDGGLLSGAKLYRFSHNDISSCKNLLTTHRGNYKNCLIITEHVFSMDGDIAPIDELYTLADKYDAWLMTDDAHGLGVIVNSSSKIPHIQMGTLSKAAGSYGGYVCASKIIIDYLANSSRSLIYSTSLPPATLAASIAALKIISENKELCTKPLENAMLFTQLIGANHALSPIIPFILGDEKKAIAAGNQLENQGLIVAAIRPPTVPAGTSRLRFAFSALHKTADIEKLAMAIKKLSYE